MRATRSPNFVRIALVLNGIMQQRGDDFLFAAAVLNHDGRNAEQVADVGLALALAALMEVQLRRVAKRFHETVCENGIFDDGLFADQFFGQS